VLDYDRQCEERKVGKDSRRFGEPVRYTHIILRSLDILYHRLAITALRLGHRLLPIARCSQQAPDRTNPNPLKRTANIRHPKLVPAVSRCRVVKALGALLPGHDSNTVHLLLHRVKRHPCVPPIVGARWNRRAEKREAARPRRVQGQVCTTLCVENGKRTHAPILGHGHVPLIRGGAGTFRTSGSTNPPKHRALA
jgi:hypothetical protein